MQFKLRTLFYFVFLLAIATFLLKRPIQDGLFTWIFQNWSLEEFFVLFKPALYLLGFEVERWRPTSFPCFLIGSFISIIIYMVLSTYICLAHIHIMDWCDR